MSNFTDEGVMNVKAAGCDALLAKRVEAKMKGKKVGDVLNRLSVAAPKPRDGRKREVSIPPSVAAARGAAAAAAAAKAAAEKKGDGGGGGEAAGGAEPMAADEAPAAADPTPAPAAPTGPSPYAGQLTGRYELVAVLTHKGRSADSGHYVSWARLPEGGGAGPDAVAAAAAGAPAPKKAKAGSANGATWIQYDDDTLSPRTPEEVLALSGGGDWHMAYLLLYRAVRAP